MMATTAHVLWLAEIRACDLARVGGKIARLGELAAAGYDVPRGFAIPVDAFSSAVPAPARAQIEALVAQASDDPRGLDRVAARVRAVAGDAPLAPELEAAVREAYARLGDVAVAVRSSGVAEDGEAASFAGQFDTYLGIRGADRVVEHVRACWASQFTGRALAYARRRGLAAGASGMAVGVLEMVDARCAGIAMTLDPIDGDRRRVVVEANWGLGESVVSGAVTPDRWVVDKRTGAVADRRVAGKLVWSAFDEAAGRVVEQPAPAELREAACLADDEVRRIADMAVAIEAREGAAQDVEWALATDGRLVLLQHRPETAWREEDAAPGAEPFDPVAFALRHVLGVPEPEGPR